MRIARIKLIFYFISSYIVYASSQNFYQQLDAFEFLNSGMQIKQIVSLYCIGTVQSSDEYVGVTQCSIYTETPFVDAVDYSWALWGTFI